jgi:predicted Zn-dependent peptidase
MTFFQHVLPNGLTLVGERSPSARSVALGFFVRTGARDESSPESGVSHFLEHMVFKGTPRRSALDVNRDFDRIGANYNAYTSEENTVFYAAVLPEYLPQGVDILADILRPSLRGEDFDVEKNVIIEEIGMYEDQPMWCAYDRAKKAYFDSHPLGNSVLGTADSIRALTRDQMQAYYDRRYIAPNITIAVAGNFDWPRVVALAQEHCGSWPTGQAPRGSTHAPQIKGAFEVLTRQKVVQEQVFILSPAPAADAPLRHAADTLAMIVGDDTGSRLYWALVDVGLADSADMNYHDYEGAGSFFTSFSCEPDNTEENLQTIRDLLSQVQADGVTQEELDLAKSKILSRVVRSGERPMGRMQSLGMAWTYLHTYRSVDDELKAFEAVTLQDIRRMIDEYPFDRLATVALGPLPRVAEPA